MLLVAHSHALPVYFTVARLRDTGNCCWPGDPSVLSSLPSGVDGGREIAGRETNNVNSYSLEKPIYI